MARQDILDIIATIDGFGDDPGETWGPDMRGMAESLLVAYDASIGHGSVLWVSGTGNDASDGRNPSTAKLTIQAAYAALPSTGGTVFALPGRYDMGAGWNLTRGKPIALIGLVKPPSYIVSTTQVPLTHNCAIIYTSTGAVSMITSTAGTAANKMTDCRFENLLFEFSDPDTLYALSLASVCWSQFVGCYFFADKVTGPANPGAVGIWLRGEVAYSDADASWNRINNNGCMNMALCILGNPTGTKYNNNQNVVRENVGLGLSRTNTTTALPFVNMYRSHRSVVRDNNVEAYYRGIYMDKCYSCTEDSDGGEYVDIFIDLVDCKGLHLRPQGITYAVPGSTTPIVDAAMLVRGDSTTKSCVILLPTSWDAANLGGLYQPLDDATDPAISLASNDNVVIAGSKSLFYGTEVPAVGGGGSADISFATVTSDQALATSNTTLQNVTALAFTAEANTTYFVEVYLKITSGNATMDGKAAWTLPSGDGQWGALNSGSTTFPTFAPQATSTTNVALNADSAVMTFGTPGSGNAVGVSFGAWLHIGVTGGTVQFRAAQNTSDAGVLTIKADSFLCIKKLT
jgi:hypothetical protein